MTSHSESKGLVPFFVADRPASLRILRGIPIKQYEGPLGIMAHANTTFNFRKLLKDFPCGAFHRPSGKHDKFCARLLSVGVIKICDSGVFTKEGATVGYDELFQRYDHMDVDLGIIIDVPRDMSATLESAKKGWEIYSSERHRFELLGVAQGRTTAEYLRCYNELKRIGFERIAIGGLLAKRRNTSHYVHVRGNGFLYRVLESIRLNHPTDWIFALGCYHPKRHLRFERLHLFGSDYKGWIFNYKPLPSSSVAKARSSRFRQVRQFISREIYESPLYLNGAQDEVTASRRSGKRLVIVSCGSRKIWDVEPRTGPTRAKDAYVGLYFKANRDYAEKFGDSWAILSAKYGLVSPDFTIPANYNQKLSLRGSFPSSLSIRRQALTQGFHRFAEIVVLGGRDYVALVVEAYAGMGIPISAPLSTRSGIGLMYRDVLGATSSGRPLPPGSRVPP